MADGFGLKEKLDARIAAARRGLFYPAFIRAIGPAAIWLAEARRSLPLEQCLDLVPLEAARTFAVCGTADDVGQQQGVDARTRGGVAPALASTGATFSCLGFFSSMAA